MDYFFAVSMVIFGFLTLVWTKKNWVNFLLKFTFLGMSGWAGFLLATSLGYIVKT